MKQINARHKFKLQLVSQNHRLVFSYNRNFELLANIDQYGLINKEPAVHMSLNI